MLQQNRLVTTATQVYEVYNNTGYGLVLLCKVLVISARGDNNLLRNGCSRVFPPLALSQKWPSKFAPGVSRSVPELPTTLFPNILSLIFGLFTFGFDLFRYLKFLLIAQYS